MGEIVREHLLKGRPVTRLLYDETVEDNSIKSLSETNFYKKQHRVALRNCGVINPENIDEYIAFDGYQALGKALTTMTPDEVIQTILDRDRKSTRLNSSHSGEPRMPSSA